MMKRSQIVKNRRGNSRGFTLIEIIAVLVILAIFTAVAISSVTGKDAASLQAEVDTLTSHLRYAQALAMNDISSDAASPTRWGITVSGPSYTLIKDISGAQTSPYHLPNESSETHTTTLTGTWTETGTVLFDELGSPSATSVTYVGQQINITTGTGFIQ
jgi:MSHA pilin protein MshC